MDLTADVGVRGVLGGLSVLGRVGAAVLAVMVCRRVVVVWGRAGPWSWIR